jgi:hypothetical protein
VQWGLDDVFPLADQETTIREQCRAGFVTAVRHSAGPYAVILRPPDFFKQLPISDADFSTLEEEIRSVSQQRPFREMKRRIAEKNRT